MKTKCKISIGFLSMLLFSSLLFTRSAALLPLVLSVALHELGHVILAKACGIRMKEFKLDIFGAALTPSNSSFSYTSEILLCLGGPLMNFFTASIVAFLPQSQPCSQFISYSIALGTLNMLPIYGFDGGRIFSCLLSLFLSPSTVLRIMRVISFLFIFCLWSFSVYLLLKAGVSLAAFIFSLSLFAKIFLPHGSASSYGFR